MGCLRDKGRQGKETLFTDHSLEAKLLAQKAFTDLLGLTRREQTASPLAWDFCSLADLGQTAPWDTNADLSTELSGALSLPTALDLWPTYPPTTETSV